MISLTLYNTNKHVYIDEKTIARVTDGHDLVGINGYPWTELVVVMDDGKEKKYNVIESAKTIGRLITESMKNKKGK